MLTSSQGYGPTLSAFTAQQHHAATDAVPDHHTPAMVGHADLPSSSLIGHMVGTSVIAAPSAADMDADTHELLALSDALDARP